jgi:ABC-type lipoprotein export system ATPase subunit
MKGRDSTAPGAGSDDSPNAYQPVGYRGSVISSTIAPVIEAVYSRSVDGRPLIHLDDVVKRYETPAGSLTALKSVSLEVGSGEFVAVIGKSGSGKSTLVNMITGIDRPSSGGVWVDGTAVHELSEGATAQWRGRTVGVVFQFFQLLPTISLLDNVVLPMEFCRLWTPRERRERAHDLLARVGLAEKARKLPAAVSGGEQQRVAIARALATNAPLLVADEPTGNLDSATAASMIDLFEQLVADKKTVLIVTHDNDMAARATRTVVVADGTVVNEYVRTALATFDLDQLGVASAHLRRETYAPGSVIVRQGEVADALYIITAGEVEVYLRHPDGADVMVNRHRVGEYFGEIALLHGGTRRATVRAAAEAETEVMALDRETFEQLMRESEPAQREFLREIDARLSAG